MRHRTMTRLGGPWIVLALCALGAGEGQEPEQKPRDLGLVERSERRLFQLDVSLRGPWEAIQDLTAEDFELAVGGVRIERVIVDRSCTEPANRKRAPGPTVMTGVPESSAQEPRASFLFYFDQHLLTLSGRQNAIDLARRMVPRLVREGNRGAIVSSGKRLATLADLTEDPQQLLAALQRLERDRDQWVLYPQQEESRIREVLNNMDNLGGTLPACGMARRFYIEESQHTAKALRLFAMTLGHLAGHDPPKVVFYFADMLRRAAGAHYLTYVGHCSASASPDRLGVQGEPPAIDSASLEVAGGFGTEFALDHVIEEAAAQGTRVYAIRAEGLVAPDDTSRRQALVSNKSDNLSTTNMQRYAQAGDSLGGLALETGGRAFVSGEDASRIVAAVDDDLGCMYLVSFDPAGLPEDRLLRVSLRVDDPRIKAFTRGQLVIQSEAARRDSRLLSAFIAAGSLRTDVPLYGAIVPTGFDHGRYTAMVQVRAAGSHLPRSTWEIGASLVTAGEVKGDASAQISVNTPDVPVVFEAEMGFRPGPFELVLVAREQSTDQLGTDRMEGAWPLRDAGPAITPIAVLQPASGAFVRGGESRTSGPLAIDEAEPLRIDRPTALVGLACRGASQSERFTLERVLVGDQETRFEDLEIELGDEPCVQFRDVIAAGTMTPGTFTYRVRMLKGDQELAVVERRFGASAGPAAASTSGTDDEP